MMSSGFIGICSRCSAYFLHSFLVPAKDLIMIREIPGVNVRIEAMPVLGRFEEGVKLPCTCFLPSSCEHIFVREIDVALLIPKHKRPYHSTS